MILLLYSFRSICPSELHLVSFHAYDTQRPNGRSPQHWPPCDGLGCSQCSFIVQIRPPQGPPALIEVVCSQGHTGIQHRQISERFRNSTPRSLAFFSNKKVFTVGHGTIGRRGSANRAKPASAASKTFNAGLIPVVMQR